MTEVTTIIEFPGEQSYSVIRYPGGETQVRIVPQFIDAISQSTKIVINARIRTAQDLMELLLLNNALRGCTEELSTSPQHILRIPYMPYARADRRFVPGDCSGLFVFSGILEYCGDFDSFETLDVHSGNAEAFFDDQLTNVPPRALIERTLRSVEAGYGKGSVLFPDEGAAKRYGSYNNWPTLFATKKRNAETGKLEGFNVPEISLYGPVVIVDDICDGGGTFLGIAEALSRDHIVTNPLFLYVTHGIFSKGLSGLREHFTHIYTTDSVVPLERDADFVTTYSAFEAMDQA